MGTGGCCGDPLREEPKEKKKRMYGRGLGHLFSILRVKVCEFREKTSEFLSGPFSIYLIDQVVQVRGQSKIIFGFQRFFLSKNWIGSGLVKLHWNSFPFHLILCIITNFSLRLYDLHK